MSLNPTQRNADEFALAAWIGVAVLLHVPLLAALSLWDPPQGQHGAYVAAKAPASRSFSVRVVPVPKKTKKPDPADDSLAKQFVTAPMPDKVEVPDQAKYLDRVSSKTEKETVRKATPGAPIELSTADSKSRDRSNVDTPRKQNDAPDISEKNVEGLKTDKGDAGDLAVEQHADLRREPGASGKGQRGNKSGGLVLPTFENTPYINPNGENGSIDYLRDLDDGERTLLNRKESRYAAFFDRVKLQIRQEWSPVSKYRSRDPYGNVYGVKDRYSRVRVTLNGDGTVRQLYVDRPSGLDFYDDEAVRSIRAAAPFHNPPEGLKDEDGLVHFQFGFMFEIQAGPSMRLFQ